MDTIEIETEVSRRHKAKLTRRRARFVMLPYPAILELAAALNNAELAVLAHLAHEMWKLGTDTIQLTNAPFKEAGFSKDARRRALHRLERAGAIQVIRNHRRSPQVRLIFRIYAN